MTKFSLVTLALLLAGSSSFASELACWSLFAKRGDRPNLTAEVVGDNKLENIQILNDTVFGEFDQSDMKSAAAGVLITNNRSFYKGLQEFVLAEGIRVILPPELTPDGLTTSIRAGGLQEDLMARQNGVIDVAGDRLVNTSGGHVYVRMHCVLK